MANRAIAHGLASCLGLVDKGFVSGAVLTGRLFRYLRLRMNVAGYFQSSGLRRGCLPLVVCAPAGYRPVLPNSAGVPAAAFDGDEPLILGRVCLTLVDVFALGPPADRGEVCPKGACVEVTAAYGCEIPAFGRGCLSA